MKYVALISGGKDSCLNIEYCTANGHELIAAASLSPEAGKEELDSYMYQTVGQDAIELVAQALEVPLHRRVISGTAVEQGSEYGARNPQEVSGIQGDETEDLFELLSEVKTQHPDVQGVSVGAILSNYQRVRVEHVCRRLGLTPLCYLWQQKQSYLYLQMVEYCRMKAMFIKVAGIGLKPWMLGHDIGKNQEYGLHMCGEGGEYETFTLNTPAFKRQIVVHEQEKVILSDHDFATVAYLRIKRATLEPKHVPRVSLVPEAPPLLEEESTAIREAVEQSSPSEIDVAPSINSEHEQEDFKVHVSSGQQGRWVAVTNVHRDINGTPGEVSIVDEVRECFQILKDRLASHSLLLSNCSNINVFLSSMEIFASVNAVYSTFFGTSPPTRAAVAVDLPSPLRVKLDAVAYAEEKPFERHALHVQSLSYWAPANIGPYSQAIMADERLFVSGQIGMIPSDLSLPSPRSLSTEAALALQHVRRVTDAVRDNTGGQWKGHTQLALYWFVNEIDVLRVKQAWQAYEEEKHTPTLFTVIKELPKNALMEKQVLVHTGRCLVKDEDDDEETLEARRPSTQQGDIIGQDVLVHWELSRFTESGAACVLVCVHGADLPESTLEELKAIEALANIWSQTLSIRLFHASPRTSSFSSLCDALYGPDLHPPITTVPCRFLATRETNNWDYAMCIIAN